MKLFSLSAFGLMIFCAGVGQTAPAQEPWLSTVLASDLKVAPAYYNSQRLALDRRGRPSVIYVKSTGAEDTLYYARTLGTQWRHENIYTMQHSGKAPSGITAYALAMDRRDRPNVYLYTANYGKSGGSIFEERWAYWDVRWQMRLIRHSKDSLGGAALHDANVAIDLRGNLNVTGYAHNAYGLAHRVRHRYFDGSAFQFDPFPRPPGKADSEVANLAVDGRNTIHFVYGARKALGRGHAEPGYPDTSLVYVTRTGTQWSAPELIQPRVGPDPADTDYYLVSAGINLDRRGDVHVTYAISKRGKTDPTYILYAWRDGSVWRQQSVATVPAATGGNFRVAVSSPAMDAAGNPHLAYDTPRGATYAVRQGNDWITSDIQGDLQGFAMDPRTGVHILCSSGSTLTYHVRPSR